MANPLITHSSFKMTNPTHKLRVNAMKLILKLSLFLCLLLGTQQSFGQITFVNPDIEEPNCLSCAGCAAPSWTVCALSPDIQPGQWGVNVPPQSGCTYAGFASGEYIGQKLSCALVPGKTYRLTAWLAYDPIYCATQLNGGCVDAGSRGAPGNLLVYAGTGQCTTNELLWQSGTLPASADKNWTQYSVVFTPVGGPYDYVLFVEVVTLFSVKPLLQMKS